MVGEVCEVWLNEDNGLRDIYYVTSSFYKEFAQKSKLKIKSTNKKKLSIE